MASLKQLWIDQFDNATVDLGTDVGNGFVSEPAGTSLLVGCNAGQQCDGYNDLNSPLATQDLDAAIQAGGGDPAQRLTVIEARITGFTYSDVNCIEYVMIGYDKTHAFWFGWFPSNSNMYLQGRLGGASGQSFGNWAGYPNPSTTPHRRRIIVNRTQAPQYVPDTGSGSQLANGDVAFLVSTDEGVSWTWLATRSLFELAPASSPDLKVGFTARNWSSFPSMQQDADYLDISETTDAEVQRYIPNDPLEPTTEAAFTDEDIHTLDRPGHLPRKPGAYTEGAGGIEDYQFHELLEDDHQGAGLVVPQVTKQPRTTEDSATYDIDEATFRDGDNAGVGPGSDALSYGFGAGGGPPRYLFPTHAPTEDKRFGGKTGEPWKLSVPPYPTDGRALGTSVQINTRREGVDYGTYAYPAEPNAPHYSEAGVLDELTDALSTPPDYSSVTIDNNGRPHFANALTSVVGYFLYDTDGELWTTPTDPSFTGYARDGKYYVNGIDQGSQAPWALEPASNNRAGGGAFPNRALIVLGYTELVIFSLDSYPTHLNMWMRFLLSSTSSAYMLGMGGGSLRSVSMKDAVMVVATQQTSLGEGRLHLISFKATDQNCANLISPTNHWNWAGGLDITHRNETGHWTSGASSLRLFSEYNRSVATHQIGDTLYIATAGEDAGDPLVLTYDSPSNTPQSITQAFGDDIGPDNDEDNYPRTVLFDAQGFLWHSVGNLLFRNLADYTQGVITCSTTYGQRKYVRLPALIRHMIDDGPFLWLGTDAGIYKMDKATTGYRMVYGIAGSGAGGRLSVEGAGELIPGTKPAIAQMQLARLAESSFLTIATGSGVGGGTVVIRLYDDAVLDSKVYPDLDEHGAYSHGVVYG